MPRSPIALLLAATLTLVAPRAAAQDPPPQVGVLVRMEAGRLVVTLDGLSGVTVGTMLGLFRPVTIRHPLTRRTITDRLPLGVVVVDHIGASLATARPEGTLTDTPRVGDLLAPLDSADAAAPPASPAVTPPPATTPPSPPSPPSGQAAPPQGPPRLPDRPPQPPAPPGVMVTPEERELLELLMAGLGRTPELRMQLYQRYLLNRRDASAAQRLRAELALMQQFREALATHRTSPSGEGRVRLAIAPQPIEPLRIGEPASVVIQLEPGGVRGEGALYVRAPGGQTYERVAMRASGDGYLRGDVPPRLVDADGFEYFVEVTTADGATTPVVGRADAPRSVEVRAPPEGPPAPRGRSRVDLRGEYADVGTRTIGGVERVQRFVTVEGDFFQRLGSRWLYGYRVGFGIYDGEALPLAQLTTTNAAVHARVIYGYHELEFAFSDFVHLIGRLQVGVHREGLVVGAQARMRIGAERRTNVLFGGDLFGEVGQRAFFAFNFAPVAWLPMMAQAEVFNQSVAAGDPMFRFIAQAGVRASSWFTVSARGSYQLRNIENGGFGGGLAMTFDW